VPKIPQSSLPEGRSLTDNTDLSSIWPILSGHDHVQIIYKNQIKVHYSNEQEAQADLYRDYDQRLDLSKGGIVYPFTGIRGDAKELWKQIKNGNLP
jgi:hypothetical protein